MKIKNQKLLPSIVVILLLSVLSTLLLTATGCKKYPDGPLISVNSKTQRVANDWKVGQAFENGKDVTSDYNKYELNLTKSGGARLSAKYTFLGSSYEYETNGKWTFVSDKEKLSIDYEDDKADVVYEILKLKEKEMWLKEDGSTLELHLVER